MMRNIIVKLGFFSNLWDIASAPRRTRKASFAAFGRGLAAADIPSVVGTDLLSACPETWCTQRGKLGSIFFLFGLISLFSLLLTGCVSSNVPVHQENVCYIFHQHPDWYWLAKKAEHRWYVPISTMMAIMHYESSFDSTARPPRKKILFFIPGARPSSAYGYAQVINQTWDIYKTETSNFDADRTDFGDAVDFVGWYVHRIHYKLHIHPKNAYAAYLAYHEGIINYQRGSYKSQKWLMNYARKVQNYANSYQKQLRCCERVLQKYR